MNNKKRGGGSELWQKFVKQGINMLNADGYLVFVNPTSWRKPESEQSRNRGLFKLMTNDNFMILINMNNSKDGLKIFNAGTRFDWYILQKKKPINFTTTIIDETGSIYKIDLSNYEWLGNSKLELIDKLIGKDKEKSVNIIYSRSQYGTDKEEKCEIIGTESSYETRKKKWTSEIKSEEFKYALIHSTPKSGHRYYYSKVNDKGHFGVAKVIFGESGIYDPIIDMEGKYGMTQHAMAIKVDNLKEAENIKKALVSKGFQDLLPSMMWGLFRIDWRLFSYFKKDFWKEFI